MDEGGGARSAYSISAWYALYHPYGNWPNSRYELAVTTSHGWLYGAQGIPAQLLRREIVKLFGEALKLPVLTHRGNSVRAPFPGWYSNNLVDCRDIDSEGEWVIRSQASCEPLTQKQEEGSETVRRTTQVEYTVHSHGKLCRQPINPTLCDRS